MDDVTDTVFRRVVADTAAPDVFFTEFASVDGLQSKGRSVVMEKLQFISSETPLIAQLWGLNPENFFKSAQEIARMGFAGVDLNMGCPVPKVIKMGACSALMNNRTLAAEIIAATKEGLGGTVAFSVKTRIGFDSQDLAWTQLMLEQGLDALTVHGRTVKELSKVPNHWDYIEQVRLQRDTISPATKIIGNGDVMSRMQGEYLAKNHGLDGIMIGRGIFHDPFVFSRNSPWLNMTKSERIHIYKRHIELFEQTWGKQRNPARLKKFAKIYINGFDGATQLRAIIMASRGLSSIVQAIEKY